MKKIIASGLIMFSVFLILTSHNIAYAQGGMMGTNDQEQPQSESMMKVESVDTVLADMLKNHDVTTVQKLDLSKISDDEWERLGDAVMELQHPGQAHEIMDQMMGGEGSESLRQIHINMGKAYLSYGGNYDYGMMGRGMMGGGMLSLSGVEGMRNFSSNPMGVYGWGFGFIAMILIWGLIIFGVVVLLKWIISQGKNQTQEKSSLDIAKERYAKGEIDKKEFEEIKKELK